MRGRDFLRDKLPQMAILLFVTLFLCGILYAYRLNALGILFVAACILLGAAAGYWIEYARRRGFYRNLLEEMEELSPKYLIAEMLEEPSFFEGKVLCQVVREAGKSMNDHIALYKNASDEYREYIEAWVHEVKTPIASARLLALNHPGPVMESMDEEISKINGFVEQALYYSKSNCLEKDYVISKVNLEEPVKKALKQHAKALIGAGIAVELRDLAENVYADEKWLVFMLGQILANAEKYGAKKIRCFADASPGGVLLHIWDNGRGIPEKDLPRIFEKGFTGENGRQMKSTGLGLYLCRKLCEKQGLNISAKSKEREYSEILMFFPIGTLTKM